MIIDMHMHERTFSGDSRMNLLEMIAEAKLVGLDGICITDHDKMGLGRYAEIISEREDFPVFVGVEYLACEGDVVAFGIDHLPEPHLPAQEFLDFVAAQSGVAIAAHPYRGNSRGFGDELYRMENLIGVEVLNGSSTPEENRRAGETCRALGLKAFGASDAHTVKEIGRYATEIPGFFTTVDELVEAIKTEDVQPVILSGYRPFDFSAAEEEAEVRIDHFVPIR